MIYILRHARTKAEDEKRILGRVDESINDDQYVLVREKALELNDKNIRTIYTSPLKRCIETAQIIGKELGIDIEIDVDIIERDFGLLSGLTWEEFTSRYPDEVKDNKENYQPHLKDAESIEDVKKRVKGFVKKVKGDDNVLLVTHTGVIRIILREFGNISVEGSREMKIGNLGLFKI